MDSSDAGHNHHHRPGVPARTLALISSSNSHVGSFLTWNIPQDALRDAVGFVALPSPRECPIECFVYGERACKQCPPYHGLSQHPQQSLPAVWRLDIWEMLPPDTAGCWSAEILCGPDYRLSGRTHITNACLTTRVSCLHSSASTNFRAMGHLRIYLSASLQKGFWYVAVVVQYVLILSSVDGRLQSLYGRLHPRARFRWLQLLHDRRLSGLPAHERSTAPARQWANRTGSTGAFGWTSQHEKRSRKIDVEDDRVLAASLDTKYQEWIDRVTKAWGYNPSPLNLNEVDEGYTSDQVMGFLVYFRGCRSLKDLVIIKLGYVVISLVLRDPSDDWIYLFVYSLCTCGSVGLLVRLIPELWYGERWEGEYVVGVSEARLRPTVERPNQKVHSFIKLAQKSKLILNMIHKFWYFCHLSYFKYFSA